MIHKEFALKTVDKLVLYGQSWAPEGEPEAVVALVHGFGEHSSRYEHWAERFVAKKIVLISFDLRGHGHSEGKQGSIPSYARLMNDIDIFLERVHQNFPEKPVFLYGHSMGGNLVLNYAISRNPEVNGFIVTGPWLRLVKELSGLVRGPVRVLRWIFPEIVVPSGLDARGLSHDQKVVEAYITDPLVHGRISLRMYFSIHDAGRNAISLASRIKHPLLVMHGAEDPVCDPRATEALVDHTTGDTTLKLWEGLYHEIHNEPEKDEVFAEIYSWMQQHLKSS